MPETPGSPRSLASQVEGVEEVEIARLRGGFSPRLDGADPTHAARLAEVADDLPPIVVQRSSMRVVDGVHRLAAAKLRGDQAVLVVYFDGSDEDAFVAAVRLNVRHGMPLTAQDRSAAAQRILDSHPHWSDRWIASVCGVAPRTVALLRRRSPDERARSATRLGRDGRRRPTSAAAGRQRAEEVIRRRPEASLREVAREAGISVGTAMDVRRKLTGQAPTPVREASAPAAPELARLAPASVVLAPRIRAGLERLAGDPSLRYTERGRALLRSLSMTLAFISQSEGMAAQVPGHCRELLRDVAEACARSWEDFSTRLIDTDPTDHAA